MELKGGRVTKFEITLSFALAIAPPTDVPTLGRMGFVALLKKTFPRSFSWSARRGARHDSRCN